MYSCQCNTVATLIHKGEDLPRNELKNCRPTFLLNSDYKLLAKCLTLRLSRVTCDISNIDQVGCIKGLRVSSLLRLIDDITDKQNVWNGPGLLVTIDYLHAFNCISEEFMVTAFQHFGVGVYFVNCVCVWSKTPKAAWAAMNDCQTILPRNLECSRATGFLLWILYLCRNVSF